MSDLPIIHDWYNGPSVVRMRLLEALEALEALENILVRAKFFGSLIIDNHILIDSNSAVLRDMPDDSIADGLPVTEHKKSSKDASKNLPSSV